MSPIIDGTHYEFRTAGLLNGLAIMEDIQTRSYWEHVTGESVHGPLRGARLEQSAPLVYAPAEAAAARFPDARLALSQPSFRQRALHRVFLRRMLSEEGHLPFMFPASMTDGDRRRPDMELGLGLWWPGVSRFYPLDVLQQHGNAVFDQVGDRRVLVFVDPASAAPTATHTEASECRWDGDDLVLNTGEVIRDGRHVDAKGQTRMLQMLPQLFTRWYGFSATFPGCSVFQP